jgi:hypothetical protein
MEEGRFEGNACFVGSACWFQIFVDFEVRKSDPQTLAAAIEIAKKHEKSVLLSGKCAEKKQKKKVHFAISDSSTDEESDKEEKKSSRELKQAPLAKVAKEELQTLRQAIEDVKVQMFDIKKSRKPIQISRTNVWCTRCKKRGH